MTKFIQLHSLISYPPSNLNRDDLGNPKTARIGGVERLRISSQSLKRAWRTSEVFQQSLSGNQGTRTRRLGLEIFSKFKQAGIEEKKAQEWAKQIAAVYGKLRTEKNHELEIEQLVHIAPEEHDSLNQLIKNIISGKRAPDEDELKSLLHEQQAVDIAMFGRMLAAKPEWNTEAAVQVAHAIGVHASTIEEDYFTAVDDLKDKKILENEIMDTGAAHVGQSGYAAAVFYQYICINRDLLKKNLGSSETLTQKALRALVESVLTVAPNGKQNSYASRAYAHYALVERGERQPRSLSLAFLKPITGDDYANAAVRVLENTRENMDVVYGACASSAQHFNVMKGEGSLQALLDFAATE